MKCVVPASHTNDLRMETKASFQNVTSRFSLVDYYLKFSDSLRHFLKTNLSLAQHVKTNTRLNAEPLLTIRWVKIIFFDSTSLSVGEIQ